MTEMETSSSSSVTSGLEVFLGEGLAVALLRHRLLAVLVVGGAEDHRDIGSHAALDL